MELQCYFLKDFFQKNDSEPLVDVKMIDFAHVFPANDKLDDNYLFGLNNLIAAFENLWIKQKTSCFVKKCQNQQYESVALPSDRSDLG